MRFYCLILILSLGSYSYANDCQWSIQPVSLNLKRQLDPGRKKAKVKVRFSFFRIAYPHWGRGDETLETSASAVYTQGEKSSHIEFNPLSNPTQLPTYLFDEYYLNTQLIDMDWGLARVVGFCQSPIKPESLQWQMPKHDHWTSTTEIECKDKMNSTFKISAAIKMQGKQCNSLAFLNNIQLVRPKNPSIIKGLFKKAVNTFSDSQDPDSLIDANYQIMNK